MNRIKIDRDRTLGVVNPLVFGGFLEHYNKIVYGGIFEPSPADADQDGFSRPVLEALCEAGTPLLRWPGGNFASGYHWEDGIGDRNARAATYDLEWMVEEPNTFGTAEFISYCRKLGAEPYVCVNAGDGTAAEAAHWVEYCNIKGKSRYAALRENHGYPDPFAVSYWGIGNEVYGRGQIGRKEIDQYIICVREYSKLMKRVDPTIKIVAVGLEKTEWNFKLVKEAGEYIDYIAVHSYHIEGWEADYRLATSLSVLTGEQLHEMKCSIDAASYYIKDRRRRPVEIAFDEWNLKPWDHSPLIEWLTLAYDYNQGNRELRRMRSDLTGAEPRKSRDEIIALCRRFWEKDNLDSRVTMADAAYVASVLNSVIRMCGSVTMGNFSPVVNGKGIVSTTSGTLVKRPTYHVFSLYRRMGGKEALDLCVRGETFAVELDSLTYNTNRIYDIPVIDISAVFSDAEKILYVAAVNRNSEAAEDLQFHLDGFTVTGGSESLLEAEDSMSFNDADHPDAVRVRSRRLAVSGGSFSLSLPEHAVAMYEFTYY